MAAGFVQSRCECAETDVGENSHAEHGLAWWPDSKQLAYLSDRDKQEQLELYIQTPGAEAKKLTTLTGFLETPRSYSDGAKIAVLFTENASRAAGPLEPSIKDSGVVEEKFYGSGWPSLIRNPAKFARYSRRPTSTSTTGLPTARIVYTAAKGNGDNNWWIAQLYTVTPPTGEMQTHLQARSIRLRVPAGRKDGRRSPSSRA